jgi:hypothetical protein
MPEYGVSVNTVERLQAKAFENGHMRVTAANQNEILAKWKVQSSK